MNKITCGKCQAVWTGEGRCHCGNCHRTFAGLKAFDTHQINGAQGSPCVDPASRGMIEVTKPWGIMWSLGSDPSERLEVK